MTRRLAVAAVGLVSAVGVGTEETWGNLLAGKRGVAPIRHFDATGFVATVAAQVKAFDPFQYGENKELKKVGLFIVISGQSRVARASCKRKSNLKSGRKTWRRSR